MKSLSKNEAHWEGEDFSIIYSPETFWQNSRKLSKLAIMQDGYWHPSFIHKSMKSFVPQRAVTI